MLRLRYKHSHSFITLDTHSRQLKVPVLRKNGEDAFVEWHGFIELDQARSWKSATPVKIAIELYALSGSDHWIKLEQGEFLQGCLTRGSTPWEPVVFGVMVDGAPRLVSYPLDTMLPFQRKTGGRTYS